jgi:ribosomal protein S18 acetylase RimI-like enzyme
VGDLAWAEAILEQELGGRMQARRGELIDVLSDGGLVAELDGRPVGVVSWRVDAGRPARRATAGSAASAEITAVAVDAKVKGGGFGRALLRGAESALRARRVSRIWLVTTNENLTALALYQKVGYRLTALRVGAIDEIRQTFKPSIPMLGANGIPMRDELELELLIAE